MFFTPIFVPTAMGTTPPTIFGANLLAWYKADVGVFSDAGITLATNAQNVAQWNDQSGHGYNLSVVGGTNPVYLTAGFNTSYKTVSFAYTSGGGLTASISLGGTKLSTFFVGQLDGQASAGGTYTRAVTLRDPAQANDYDNVGSTLPVLQWGAAADITAFRVANTPTFNPGFATPFRMASVADGTNLSSYWNGGTANTVASSGTFASSPGLYLGCGITASSVATFWYGRISEVVLANIDASGGQLAAMDTYLKIRWGL